VLSWGLGGSGQLGHGEYNSTRTPRRIHGLSGQLVQGCACGFGHTVVLTQSGELYSWGWNRDGQLGLGDCDNRNSPQRLHVGGGQPMQHVACGGGHSAIVSTSGALYCFGSASCGQLGLGDGARENVLTPTHVEALTAAGVTVALASCGEEFTLAIGVNQSVYAFGLGNVGQMGGGVDGNAELPVLVSGLEGKPAEAASCGAAQAHVVSTRGQTYAWGLAGTDTQAMVEELRRASLDTASLTGNGGGPPARDLSETLPAEVAALKGKKVVRLDAGRRHFAALTCPADPRRSTLRVPDEWIDAPPAGVPAGKRIKMTLRVVDVAGRVASAGGERVVGRLLWDGGDEWLVGSVAELDAHTADAAGRAAGASATALANLEPSAEAKAEAAERAESALTASRLVDVDDLMDGSCAAAHGHEPRPFIASRRPHR
jgi:alpha-tubulin suppressor-like RCC1 family protein